MSQQLIIASHNEGKVSEIRDLIAPLGIKVISAAQAQIEEPEETGNSFEANAILKSEHASYATGLPALADDSGLVIPALNGAPGIFSARWAGPNKDFNVAFERIQKELRNQPDPAGEKSKGTHKAHFICVLALTLPHGDHAHTHTFTGRVDGSLTFPPRGDKGFGYDPIFIPNGYNLTFGEMNPQEKHQMSHRADAFAKFLAFITRTN